MRYPIQFVLFCSLVPALGAAACTECNLRDEAINLAGPSAVNCGTVALGESRVEAHACTVEAFRNGDGFYAVFEEQGIDSHVVSAVVGSARGQVWFLGYDSGCCGDGATPKIGRRGCIEPLVEVVPDTVIRSDGLPVGSEYVGCSSPGAPYDIICEE